MTETPLSREEIVVLAKRAGLDLAPPYLDELAEAYGYVQQMVARLPRSRPRSDEPAHVFAPATFVPQEHQK